MTRTLGALVSAMWLTAAVLGAQAPEKPLPPLDAADAARVREQTLTLLNINLLQCQANSEALQKALSAILADEQRSVSAALRAKYHVPADVQLDWASGTFVKPTEKNASGSDVNPAPKAQ